MVVKEGGLGGIYGEEKRLEHLREREGEDTGGEREILEVYMEKRRGLSTWERNEKRRLVRAVHSRGKIITIYIREEREVKVITENEERKNRCATVMLILNKVSKIKWKGAKELSKILVVCQDQISDDKAAQPSTPSAEGYVIHNQFTTGSHIHPRCYIVDFIGKKKGAGRKGPMKTINKTGKQGKERRILIVATEEKKTGQKGSQREK